MIIHVTGCVDVAKIGMTFPKEIVYKILVYERYILMREHLPKFKYVLKDIEEGLKIILIDRDWYKRWYCKSGDVFWLQFPWKRKWNHLPLEGAALYIGRERIVCSKRVPSRNRGWHSQDHPYYHTTRTICNHQHQWLTRQEAKLINHEYFHR